MVSILAIGIAARLGDEQVLSSILRERPSVIVQYWTRGKKTTDVGVNHLVCVSSTGKASPEQNPIQSFSGLKISPDFSYIACSRQVAAPPDEKRDYITEIPPYNTNVQIASATQVLFKKTFHAATSIFWIGQNLHTDPDMGTTISQMEKTAPWIESKVNVPPVARRTFAQPESNGDYFSFQPDRSLPIFYYHSEGRVKTCRLNSQSPSQLMSLTGTPDFLYIDGFGGGVYILNGITGVSQKTLIRHFERSAWLPDSKILATMPVVLVPSDAHITLYDAATKSSRRLNLRNRVVRNFIALNSRELLVSSVKNSKKVLERVNPVTGSTISVNLEKYDGSSWLQFESCMN